MTRPSSLYAFESAWSVLKIRATWDDPRNDPKPEYVSGANRHASQNGGREQFGSLVVPASVGPICYRPIEDRLIRSYAGKPVCHL